MASTKEAHTLSSYYEKRYKEKYDRAPVFNRYSARWGWDAILMGMSVDKVKDIIDHYFLTSSTNGHDLQWFFYNYDKLNETMIEQKADRERAVKLREQSELRTREWLEKIGKSTEPTD